MAVADMVGMFALFEHEIYLPIVSGATATALPFLVENC